MTLLWVLCQRSGAWRVSCFIRLTVRTSPRQEQMSSYLTSLSERLHSHSLSLSIQIFFFLQISAVTKHPLSRGWFHWEALPDMRGALMWLTHTHYCCLIQGLGAHVIRHSSLLAWSASNGKYAERNSNWKCGLKQATCFFLLNPTSAFFKLNHQLC